MRNRSRSVSRTRWIPSKSLGPAGASVAGRLLCYLVIRAFSNPRVKQAEDRGAAPPRRGSVIQFSSPIPARAAWRLSWAGHRCDFSLVASGCGGTALASIA